MLPVIVPIVHAKLLATLEVRLMPVPVPLHIVLVDALVTAGEGFTVTVIVKGVPGHEPVVDVGITIYCTLPDTELLGFVSV